MNDDELVAMIEPLLKVSTLTEPFNATPALFMSEDPEPPKKLKKTQFSGEKINANSKVKSRGGSPSEPTNQDKKRRKRKRPLKQTVTEENFI